MTNFNYRIEYDNDPMNPRTDFDNVGKMVCSHRRYNLGDEQVDDLEEWLYEMAEYDEEWLYDNSPSVSDCISRIERMGYVILPLYLYEHSGITMNTGGFSCRWDSGQVGFIYVRRDKAVNEYGLKPNNWRQKAKKYLTGEVETYDAFLTGQVFGYVVFEEDENGEIVEDHIDSCWGYFEEEYCKKEAEGMVEWNEKERQRKIEEEARQTELCAAIMHI